MTKLLPLGRHTPFGIFTMIWSPWPVGSGASDDAYAAYAPRGGYIFVKS